ncbi:MAG: hypothetical protein CVU55_14225 [Deltaproteobacteria bacterium HGW-Deltaproteobacteria-13]|jgi:hypothetical protein|nr:MAG: hypothetical protein CVU55_14225 [Deltaproteobacteria bacterium HGW-Deltaproteobacteria-13]
MQFNNLEYTINLKRFSKKYILVIFIISFLLFDCSWASGQELIPPLKGKWGGTVLLQATSTGFTSSKDSIKFNILEQSNFNFKGNAESKNNGKKTLWVFEGYLGKTGRNICFINQNNKKILVGHIMTNNVIKLYSWDDENNRAIVYILSRKIESADNVESNKPPVLTNVISLKTADNESKAP